MKSERNNDFEEMMQVLENFKKWEASRDLDAEIQEAKKYYLKKDVLGINDYVLALRDSGYRCYEKKDYGKAIKYFEEARKALSESRSEPAFKLWSLAVPEAYPTLISLYCAQKEFDKAVVILNEYFNYLNGIYDELLPDQEHINVNYVAGGIADILKMLEESSSIAGKELMSHFGTAERFIKYCDSPEISFNFYSCYGKIAELIAPEECKRLKEEAEFAKRQTQF